MRRLLALSAVSLWVSACGSSSSSTSDCLTGGSAEVCASLDGGVKVTASGLEPGSDLTIDVVDGPSEVVQVDEHGSIGTIGFLTVVAPDSVRVEISGTAEGGRPLSGMLSAG